MIINQIIGIIFILLVLIKIFGIKVMVEVIY